ncbi:hypothetical protein EDB19DRAFT_1996394 [Suillus lakei]|nr:hypothetical protein EDB19DRAFT_1996394 [Suillus lakei]
MNANRYQTLAEDSAPKWRQKPAGSTPPILPTLNLTQKAYHLRKGLCFKCGQPGHKAQDWAFHKFHKAMAANGNSTSGGLKEIKPSRKATVTPSNCEEENSKTAVPRPSKIRGEVTRPSKTGGEVTAQKTPAQEQVWETPAEEDSLQPLGEDPIVVYSAKTIGRFNEFRVPAAIFSTKEDKVILTSVIVDSGAGGSFINKTFVKAKGIKTHKLRHPFHITTVDGSHSLDGKVTDYCVLVIKMDKRTMIGKFNITKLFPRDNFLMGKPWLSAMNPMIKLTMCIVLAEAEDRTDKSNRLCDRNFLTVWGGS